MKKYNIVYLTTYINQDISIKINLPYTGAGLKKKQQVLDILSDHNVQVVFVSMFSRLKKVFVKPFVEKIYNNTTLRVPFFTKMPFLNYIINPLMTFIELIKIQKEENIDYIVLYNCVYENVIPAYFMYKLYGTKVICQYEDGWTISSKGYKKIIYKLSHYIAEKMSIGVIVNSTTFLDIFHKKNYLVFRGNIEYKNLDIRVGDNDKLNVLFSSSIDEIRGVQLLIELFSNTKEKDLLNNFCFHITGKGSKKVIEELNKAIQYYNFNGGDAKYYGFVSLDELQILYEKADILLALQKTDGKFSKYCFPSKIFEYYQYNKPIITTNISDLKNDDFFNLEFIEYNVNSLIEKLYMLKQEYKKYSQKNRENNLILSEKFSTKKNREKINKFLEKLS